MRKWTDYEKMIHFRAVVLLLLAMVAVAMMAEVSKQNWGIGISAYPTTSEQYRDTYAEEILASMTLEEKVGQMLFVRCADDTAAAVSEYGYGGVALYDSDFEHRTKTEVAAYIAQLQVASAIPLMIGVDEEGGTVNRISKFKAYRNTPFLSPAELMTTGGPDLVREDAAEKSLFLAGLGINVNFAPVADVTTKLSATMHPRALGSDADDTARYVSAVVEEMRAQNMVSVLKHFPGYGNLRGIGVLRDDRSAESLEAEDFLPFVSGIEAGAPMILVGHMVTTALDDQWPASLSKTVHTVLRRQLDFDGVIITDSLTADGLEAYGSDEELVALAVEAGNDMLFTTAYKNHRDALLRAVRQGRISEERVDESVLRILKLKIEYGILS